MSIHLTTVIDKYIDKLYKPISPHQERRTPVKIYQAFVMSKVEENEDFWEKVKQTSPRWANIIRSLKARGYTILVNQNTYGSVPTSVILGTDSGSSLWRNVKKDFCGLVGELALPFESGESYVEE